MDITKLRRELGWSPKESFSSGLCKTIRWYLDNMAWVESVLTGGYQDWCERQYAAAAK